MLYDIILIQYIMSIEPKAKTVRLDTDVIKSLSNHRKGWETPNDCLKRLLNQRACTVSNKKTEEKDDDDVAEEGQE